MDTQEKLIAQIFRKTYQIHEATCPDDELTSGTVEYNPIGELTGYGSIEDVLYMINKMLGVVNVKMSTRKKTRTTSYYKRIERENAMLKAKLNKYAGSGRPPKLTNKDKDDIVYYHDNGMSVQDLKQKYKCCAETIYKALREIEDEG